MFLTASSKMPVGIPAFWMRSWSFLPLCLCFFDFLGGKMATFSHQDQSRRGCKKLKMSFLHPPFGMDSCFLFIEQQQEQQQKNVIIGIFLRKKENESDDEKLFGTDVAENSAM